MKALIKLRDKKGMSQLISSIFVILAVAVFIAVAVYIATKVAFQNNLQQIAQQMSREIGLSGQLDASTDRRLDSLVSLYKLSADEVSMTVEGDYLGSSRKLRLESSFTVVITCRHDSGFFLDKGVRTYVAKSQGIAEQYHK